MKDCIFKEGQKVWSFNSGWGVVGPIEFDDEVYPIRVQFNKDYFYFTKDGKFSDTDVARSLFFTEIPIPPEALVPPVEEIVLDRGDIVLTTQGVLVYVSETSDNQEKYFHCFDGTVPQSLEQAYGSLMVDKQYIKKIVGNIYD